MLHVWQALAAHLEWLRVALDAAGKGKPCIRVLVDGTTQKHVAQTLVRAVLTHRLLKLVTEQQMMIRRQPYLAVDDLGIAIRYVAKVDVLLEKPLIEQGADVGCEEFLAVGTEKLAEKVDLDALGACTQDQG